VKAIECPRDPDNLSELHNRVYDFTASKGTLPCLSLTHACRQLREEYLPICMKAPLTIVWKRLPRYFNTFYPTAIGTLRSIALAPSSITIKAAGLSGSPDEPIDILPLLKMQQAHGEFAGNFILAGVFDPQKFANDHALTEVDQNVYLEADDGMIGSLLQHRDERWLEAIKSGRVSETTISAVAAEQDPTVTFYVCNKYLSTFWSRREVKEDVDPEDRSFEYLSMKDLRWCAVEGHLFGILTDIIPVYDDEGASEGVAGRKE